MPRMRRFRSAGRADGGTSQTDVRVCRAAESAESADRNGCDHEKREAILDDCGTGFVFPEFCQKFHLVFSLSN